MSKHPPHMRLGAVIVAAGRGTRAGGDKPKQWQCINGKPVAAWTFERFTQRTDIAEVVLVIHPDDEHYGAEIENLRCVHGGATRDQSVLAGLQALGADITHVLIHDVARASVPAHVIDGVIAALDHSDAAAPALPVTDALWTGLNGHVSGTQERAHLYRAQTPQGFSLPAILAAHRAHQGGAADDVEVARAAGLDVVITQGDEANLKITTPDDFARAAALLEPAMDLRLGNGFDVHAFEDGDHVILCGVRIDHDKSLKGHSDADVLCHAIADAILGALGLPDIGYYFPPDDMSIEGICSLDILKKCRALADEHNAEIQNVDSALVAEAPKIMPHLTEMKANISQALGITPEQVGVKATTNETMGFVGRKEGIAAMATTCVVIS